MTLSFLRTRSFKLRNRTTTRSPKKQKRTAINRSHFPQLRPQTLVIRIPFTPTFPRKFIIFPQPCPRTGTRTESLNLQIKLRSFLESPTPDPLTLPRSCSTTQLNGDHRSDKENDECEEVGYGERDGREEEREGVEDVGEIRGEKESAGEENKEEDEKV